MNYSAGGCRCPERWLRILTLFLVSLPLSIAGHAQGNAQQREASKDFAKSLRFDLRILTPVACIGAPLKLRLEVTNTGRETVRLNQAYFWNNSLQYLSQEVLSEGEERYWEHIWPRSTRADVFLLAPGATHTAHKYWSPYEGYGPGNYTLEIGGYGKSGKVRFELQDCKPKGN